MKLEVGQFAFLRVRVTGEAENYWDGRTTPTVEIVDRLGRPTDGATRYVDEKDIITIAEAVESIKRKGGGA